MDTDSKMTSAQESYLEGQYGDLHTALDAGHWAEAEQIIKEVAAMEFWAQAADMKNLLSHTKLSEQ